MTRTLALFVSLCLSLSATAAFAQSPGDIIGRIESFIHSAMGKGAQSRWSKLPENEYACVNQKLQERGDSLQALIKRGVFPNDKRVADVRSQCGTRQHRNRLNSFSGSTIARTSARGRIP